MHCQRVPLWCTSFIRYSRSRTSTWWVIVNHHGMGLEFGGSCNALATGRKLNNGSWPNRPCFIIHSISVATSSTESNLLRHGFFFIATTTLIYQHIHCIKAIVIIWHFLLASVPYLLAVVPPKIYKSQLALPSGLPNSRHFLR